MPAQHVKASERAHEDTSPAKIDVTSKSPVGDISVVTLIRTDTTLDHSQKAEKVCSRVQITRSGVQVAIALYATYQIKGLQNGESRPGLGLKRSGV